MSPNFPFSFSSSVKAFSFHGFLYSVSDFSISFFFISLSVCYSFVCILLGHSRALECGIFRPFIFTRNLFLKLFQVERISSIKLSLVQIILNMSNKVTFSYSSILISYSYMTHMCLVLYLYTPGKCESEI